MSTSTARRWIEPGIVTAGVIVMLVLGLWWYPSVYSCISRDEPPRCVPEADYDAYTLAGKIPVKRYYFNESYPPTKPLVYTVAEVDRLLALVAERGTNYYGPTDTYLYQAFEKYRDQIAGKDVAVIGSTAPWYESIALGFGGHPITVEYNKILSEDPRVSVMTVAEYDQNPRQFDSILSISSYEHDGLGRYGDPLNPIGDLVAMRKTKGMLKPGGLLFLAVPVGRDLLVWNAHRVYGELRLPMLLEGWETVDSFGFSEEDVTRRQEDRSVHQPVFVLRPRVP